MASFDGPKFQMTDGSYVKTKAIEVGSSTDISPYLSLLREDSILNGNRAIGKLAAKACGTLVLEYLGTRELAYRVLWSDLSRLDSIESKWEEKGSEERLEAAAIEGWLIFNVWDQLSDE
ncbi:hypothetical protein EUTSA_v10015043mg [Eutrema salsugineum]|uniref:Uncharacterized protein n=1 Tax=Eutrema salsugineum TaxID=72664 RepID=V4N555_EUTSA|nr:hypothetical protein EUTSA_v10015043mg [Eutrema salsugineum]